MPKILFFDVETFPNVSYTWGKYDQNVIRFVREGCMATFVAKWLNDKRIISKALPDYKGYRPGSYDDRQLVADLWKLIDEADILVAHNGDDFDVRVANARFLKHGMKPPSPFKTVDTKKAVKRVARFNSNKLDDLSNTFFQDKKLKADFDLWEGCINGDRKSWRKMVEYNRKDVLLLEKLYLYLRPWITNHPNLTIGAGEVACPKCGSKDIEYRGWARSASRSYRRFQCQSCGGWGRELQSEEKSTVANA
jgi:DNA polymerase elongation subunit (family B)/predicted RNA-binding Zn-ribbon protein involved in translation (DUF1610 family)